MCELNAVIAWHLKYLWTMFMNSITRTTPTLSHSFFLHLLAYVTEQNLISLGGKKIFFNYKKGKNYPGNSKIK